MVVPSELLHLIWVIITISLYYNAKQHWLIKRIYNLKVWLKEEIEIWIRQEINTKYNLEYICKNPEVVKAIKRKLFPNK